MKLLKNIMVERQLLNRGIRDDKILGAFAAVDREDFVAPKRWKHTYVDSEIPINSQGYFQLRPYFLACIISRIVAKCPENLLIVGDVSGYTSDVLKHIYGENFKSCSEKEFLARNQEKFDLIYFDSKIFEYKTVSLSKWMLSDGGKSIYMAYDDSCFCENASSAYKKVNVLEGNLVEKPYLLFSWNLLL